MIYKNYQEHFLAVGQKNKMKFTDDGAEMIPLFGKALKIHDLITKETYPTSCTMKCNDSLWKNNKNG